MAQIKGRRYVEPPAFVKPGRTLYDVADVRAPGDETELMGIAYESESAHYGKFVDLLADNCLATGEKSAEGFTFEEATERADLYAAVSCSGMDPDDYKAAAALRLDRSESFLAERFMWERVLPFRGVDLNPAGAVSVVDGIGLLEQYAGQNYLGKPILHVGRRLGAHVKHLDVVDPDIADLVNGAGYYALGSPDLAAPVLAKGAAAAGGAFAAGTYFWKITALNEHGETIGSNEVTQALLLNQQLPLTWADVDGATGYKVYRGTVSNTENRLIATLGESDLSYTDTGTAGTAATVPVTNTTGSNLPVAAADEAWAYITGRVLILRSEQLNVEAYDLAFNERFALAERSILPSVDALVGAIRITVE